MVRLRVCLVALPILLGAACGRHAGTPASQWETEGRPLPREHDSVVAVLAIDPSECLQCMGVVGEWLEWRRSSGEDVRIVLARPADDVERRILSAAGLRFDGTLTRGPHPDSTPVEVVFKSGRAVYQASRVRGPSSVLIHALGRRNLKHFADSMEAARTAPY